MLHRGIGLASAAYRYNLSSKNQTSFRRETRLMALSQRLEFRQTQSLVMTPQLMQAIQLLQLSSLDLAAYVEAELERNPLLERVSDNDSVSVASEAPSGDDPDAEALKDSGENRTDWMGDALETSRASMEQSLGTELENVFPDEGGPQRVAAEAQPALYPEWPSGGIGTAGDDYNLEAFVSAETTLADHLVAQMALAIPEPGRRMIGQYLIDMVDEAGYVAGDLSTVADKLGAPLSEV